MPETLALTLDADGIATIVIDIPGKSMNAIDPRLERELAETIEKIAADPAIHGAILTSGKQSFIPGYDLGEILQQFERRQTATEAYESGRSLTRLYRRIETCGKPFAAAINGLAMGGGLELALACHYRVLADEPSAVIGLPEVKVGLLPGAGGTQRLPRLIGIEKALPLLLEGGSVPPSAAKELGIAHALVPAGEVVSAARRWLLGQPLAAQPWDQKGFRLPGGAGLTNPKIQALFAGANALVAKKTLNNYPAPAAILSCVFEGSVLPLDAALEVESKYFAQLLTEPVARNLIHTMFVNKGRADKLSARPEGVPRWEVRKLGVLGAGMMGAAIAYVSARAGMQVVLLDTTQEQAAKGKSYSANLVAKEMERGRTSRAQADALLARITPTAEFGDLADCQLVIEAVFEHRRIKAEVTRKAEAVMPADTVFASNTSTLPITGLAEASMRPAHFIGVHFFSPVEKMPLVEIIVGRKTSRETIARALDYVGRLRKTPIVVNDSRGFYTSRVFGVYSYEGQRMLEEGIDPALIENAGRMAGMPVGPLAVTDEVSLELQYKVIRQTQEDLGDRHLDPIAWPVIRHFVEDLQRPGRKGGAGFYDYPPDGKKHLWPGLAREYPRLAAQPEVGELKQRLLYIQALETARCFDEGVLKSAAEADLGSILGWGFPAWTGGTLSYIDMIGAQAFVAECRRLARRHGERYKPSRGLLKMARSGASFHGCAGG